jgi:hypothetical protein
MAASHVTLDGATVLLDGALDLSLPPSSVLDLHVGGWTFELTAGTRSLGRWAVEEISGIPLTETYSLGGGRLLVGRGSVTGADGAVTVTTAGVWEGASSSLVVLHPRAATSQDVVDLFAALRPTEAAPAAIVVDSTIGTVEREPTLAKRVADIGMIEVVPATKRTVRMVPNWRGTAVKGGELFRGRSADAPYYVLAAESAVAVIMPQHGVPLDTVAASLEDLTVSWTPKR